MKTSAKQYTALKKERNEDEMLHSTIKTMLLFLFCLMLTVVLVCVFRKTPADIAPEIPSTKILSMIDRSELDSWDRVDRYIQEYDVETRMMKEYLSPFPDGYFITGDTAKGALLINETDDRFDLYYWKAGKTSKRVDSIPKGKMENVFAYQQGYFFGYNQYSLLKANSNEAAVIVDEPLYSFDGHYYESEWVRPSVSPKGSLAYFCSEYYEDNIMLKIIRMDGAETDIPISLNEIHGEYEQYGNTPAILWQDEDTLLIFCEYRQAARGYEMNYQEVMRVNIPEKRTERVCDQNGNVIKLEEYYVMGHGNLSADGDYAGLLTSVVHYSEEPEITDSVGLLDLQEGKIHIIYRSFYGSLDLDDHNEQPHDFQIYESAVVTMAY